MPQKDRVEKVVPRIIDARSRVSVSPEAMAALGVETGDYIVWEVRGKDVVVRKVDLSVRRPA